MQAAGTAVVGARRKGLRETVCHGKTGMLIRRQRALAPTLRRLLGHPDEALHMGRHGRQWVKATFGVATAVEHWTHLLDAVVRGAPPEPPPFAWTRATPRTLLREGLRRLHARGGQRIDLLDRLLNAIRE